MRRRHERRDNERRCLPGSSTRAGWPRRTASAVSAAPRRAPSLQSWPSLLQSWPPLPCGSAGPRGASSCGTLPSPRVTPASKVGTTHARDVGRNGTTLPQIAHLEEANGNDAVWVECVALAPERDRARLAALPELRAAIRKEPKVGSCVAGFL